MQVDDFLVHSYVLQGIALSLIHISLPGRQDGKNRRQLVIDAWIGMGRVIANTGRANTAATSGSLRPSPAAENNIEITMAMMSDIKAVLSGMETSMAELSRTLKSSYAKDPEL